MRSRRGLRLWRDRTEGRAARALRSANLSAMLLYIITNAVLFLVRARQCENIRTRSQTGCSRSNLGPWGFLLVGEPAALVRRQLHGAVLDHPDHGAILFPTAMRLGIDPVAFRHPDRPSTWRSASAIRLSGLISTSPPAYRAWHHGADQGRDAVAAHHAGVPRDRDLWPWLTLVVPRAMGML